jgi:hypothetical protein
MVLVGTKTPFLSHLPMFEGVTEDSRAFTSPHRFQVILAASFTKDGADANRLYGQEREKHPSGLYTLQPSRFVLPGLVANRRTGRSVQSFGGTVFRGHLERGGQRVQELRGIQVHVKRMIHFRQFDPAAKHPGQLEYILFGAGEELFAAHVITGPPDFDQILPVVVKNGSQVREHLLNGARVVISGRENTAQARLRQGDVAEAAITGASGATLAVEAGPEIYFENGELMIPATFDNTAEEEQIGQAR